VDERKRGGRLGSNEDSPSAGEGSVSKDADPEELLPDRFYVMSDAGSIYCDDGTGEGVEGFDTPEAAAEWASRQTIWRYGSELDFSDGVTSCIVLGREINEANEAWERWAEDTSQPYPGVRVHNYAVDLGLVAGAERS
jgi:hypothetical protein